MPERCTTVPSPRRPADAAREWQAHAGRVLTGHLGFLDRPAPPVEAELEQTVDRGSYVRERVVLRTWPDATMPVYLLVPKGLTGPAPCVLALHGHGYGVRDIVGLWEDGSERWEPDGYHKDFGCALAERGFVVAAPEISCFGERRADYSALGGELTGSPPTTCHNANTYAIMLGGSVMGLRVWDGMRAVDYLATRPEADSARLGAMGISGRRRAHLLLHRLRRPHPRLRDLRLLLRLAAEHPHVPPLHLQLRARPAGPWRAQRLRGADRSAPLPDRGGPEGHDLPDRRRARVGGAGEGGVARLRGR